MTRRARGPGPGVSNPHGVRGFLSEQAGVTMQLGRLLQPLNGYTLTGSTDVEIRGMTCDSRLVQPGHLFVALRGHLQDGHRFVADALDRGAVAVVADRGGPVPARAGSTLVLVGDTRVALAGLAAEYFGRPFEGLNLIGITGTNGKTTTSYLLESILVAAGARPGVFGTVNYRMPGTELPAPVTTPDPLVLMGILRQMADEGVTDVVMEVSSHALEQGRAAMCPFRVGVFTNLSRDHLDYHGSMEAYFEVKSRLFESLGSLGDASLARAVINVDDAAGRALLGKIRVPVLTYGTAPGADIRMEEVNLSRTGLTGRLVTPAGVVPVRSRLIGAFNVFNIMAASGAAAALGIDLETTARGIGALRGVPGRLEPVENPRALTILVDFAHTPDALFNALRVVRSITRERIITVFGCGGDRDRGKRSEMGRIAAELSDLVIITSDNPRTEDPASIASSIEEGVRGGAGMQPLTGPPGPGACGYMLDIDRRRAITTAVNAAGEGDLVLIAGKGHENYQIIGTERRAFDDRKVAAQAAQER